MIDNIKGPQSNITGSYELKLPGFVWLYLQSATKAEREEFSDFCAQIVLKAKEQWDKEQNRVQEQSNSTKTFNAMKRFIGE